MTADTGIKRFGAYVPRLRLDRAAIAAAHSWMAPSLKGLAKGARAFCNWDEDSITMAVEAARDALAGTDAAAIRHLAFATTTSPYDDLQPTAIIAGALDLPKRISTTDGGFSQRAGTSGLLAAMRSPGTGLFVAADAPPTRPATTQEISFGAGAAAFVTGQDGLVARLLGAGSVAVNFVDHFRAAAAAFDYNWEERWVRDEGHARLVPEAVALALADASLGIDDIDHFVFGSMLRGAAAQAARQLGCKAVIADELADDCGYAGTAHSLLMLARVLETAGAGEKILVLSFGQGVDAIILETTDALAAARPTRGVTGSLDAGIVTDAYLRMLSFAGGIDIEWGMRSERNSKTALTEQHRSSGQFESFQAGRCGTCDTVQFPQQTYCVNCHAPRAGFESVPLQDLQGTVLTATADWLSYNPSPPLHVGFVQFANGARVQMEMVDGGADGFETGQLVAMAFRIKERDRQRGYNRYFWKAVPASSPTKAN